MSVIVENRSCSANLQSEHGLALYFEADGQGVLLDTGAGQALQPNAQALGIDLAQVRALVLSHGHQDHSGGVATVLAHAPGVPVYMHHAALRQRWSHRHQLPRAIGMPTAARQALSGADFRFTRGQTELSPDSWCTGSMPAARSERAPDPYLFCDPQGQERDWCTDDQALVFNTTQGLVVASGCCHAGLGPTLRLVKQQAPTGANLHSLIGGLHLHAATDEEMTNHLRVLDEYAPQQILAGYCTGAAAEERLAQRYGNHFVPLRGGSRWQLTATGWQSLASRLCESN